MITFRTIGLGDLIEMILSFFGVHPWEGCGCEGRKAWLNNIPLFYPVLE